MAPFLWSTQICSASSQFIRLTHKYTVWVQLVWQTAESCGCFGKHDLHALHPNCSRLTVSVMQPLNTAKYAATAETNRWPKLKQWVKANAYVLNVLVKRTPWFRLKCRRLRETTQLSSHTSDSTSWNWSRLRGSGVASSPSTVNGIGGLSLRKSGGGVVFTWQRHCVCASLLLAD